MRTSKKKKTTTTTFEIKTRSLDLNCVRRHFQKKSGRQTDKLFFSKRHLKWLFTIFSTIKRHKKRDKRSLKQLCYGPTDRRTDGPTDGPNSGLKSCVARDYEHLLLNGVAPKQKSLHLPDGSHMSRSCSNLFKCD